MNIDERLQNTLMRPSGFDYLRIFLALAVAVSHIPETAFGQQADIDLIHGIFGPYIAAILPMFFALSGFLVTGSLERSKSIRTFIGLRVIRIVPALLVEVALSALIVGPIFTVISLRDYFKSPEFISYFSNVIGEIHYFLPGVFSANPWPGTINAQLWTIPWELACYIVMIGLALIGVRRRPALVPLLILASMAAYYIQHGLRAGWEPVPSAGGLSLVWSFLTGVSIALFRKQVTWNAATLAVVICALGVCYWVGGIGLYPVPLLLSYVTVWLGLTNFKRIFVLRGADYSYGLYLYHFLVMQVVASYLPNSSFYVAIISFTDNRYSSCDILAFRRKASRRSPPLPEGGR